MIENFNLKPPPILTEDEIKVRELYWYTTGESNPINKGLRDAEKCGWDLDQRRQERVNVINKIASESLSVKEQTFYRGCRLESFKNKDGIQYDVGDVIVNPAFLSTTSDSKIADGFAQGTEGKANGMTGEIIRDLSPQRSDGLVYEIVMPKGYPMIEVNRYLDQNKAKSAWHDQEEIILGSDGGYRVKEIQKDETGKITKVKLEAIKDFIKPESIIEFEQIESEIPESKISITVKKLIDLRNKRSKETF